MFQSQESSIPSPSVRPPPAKFTDWHPSSKSPKTPKSPHSPLNGGKGRSPRDRRPLLASNRFLMADEGRGDNTNSVSVSGPFLLPPAAAVPEEPKPAVHLQPKQKVAKPSVPAAIPASEADNNAAPLVNLLQEEIDQEWMPPPSPLQKQQTLLAAEANTTTLAAEAPMQTDDNENAPENEKNGVAWDPLNVTVLSEALDAANSPNSAVKTEEKQPPAGPDSGDDLWVAPDAPTPPGSDKWKPTLNLKHPEKNTLEAPDGGQFSKSSDYVSPNPPMLSPQPREPSWGASSGRTF